MIAGKDVGVLINNVGVSYSFPKYFDELSVEEVRHGSIGRNQREGLLFLNRSSELLTGCPHFT